MENWFIYMKTMSLRKMGLSFINILRNKMENLQTSKALVLSMEHPNTSEPFLRKYPTVSTTAQEHILADTPGW